MKKELSLAEIFGSNEKVKTALQTAFLKIITTLTPREEKVLRERFGVNSRHKTLHEIGIELGIQRQSVRMIEAKALRKLRHPTRSIKLLEAFYLEFKKSYRRG